MAGVQEDDTVREQNHVFAVRVGVAVPGAEIAAATSVPIQVLADSCELDTWAIDPLDVAGLAIGEGQLACAVVVKDVVTRRQVQAAVGNDYQVVGPVTVGILSDTGEMGDVV